MVWSHFGKWKDACQLIIVTAAWAAAVLAGCLSADESIWQRSSHRHWQISVHHFSKYFSRNWFAGCNFFFFFTPLMATKGARVCQENILPTVTPPQPAWSVDAGLDQCFKFWPGHLNVAAENWSHQTRQHFSSFLLSSFVEPVQTANRSGPWCGLML